MLRQFDFNQGAIQIVGDACFASVWEVESRFMGNRRDKIVLLARLARLGVRSPGGALYWMRCIKVLSIFMSKHNKEPLICAIPDPTWAKDP